MSSLALSTTPARLQKAPSVLRCRWPRSSIDRSSTTPPSTARSSIPIDDLRTGGGLAFALDGEPLPDERGGPLRLTVAQGGTLCWNVKDVGELRFTAHREPDSVPAKPTH